MRVRAGVTESSGADTADAEMLARLEDGSPAPSAAQIEAVAEASKALDADFLELWRVLPEVKDEGAPRLAAHSRADGERGRALL